MSQSTILDSTEVGKYTQSSTPSANRADNQRMSQLYSSTQAFGCLHKPHDLQYRHGYLQSLPAREYVPIFWQDDELSMLQGTELDGRAIADRYPCLSVSSLAYIVADRLCNLSASYAQLFVLHVFRAHFFAHHVLWLAEKHAREITVPPPPPLGPSSGVWVAVVPYDFACC